MNVMRRNTGRLKVETGVQNVLSRIYGWQQYTHPSAVPIKPLVTAVATIFHYHRK